VNSHAVLCVHVHVAGTDESLCCALWSDVSGGFW